jgi:hypothetical protein
MLAACSTSEHSNDKGGAVDAGEPTDADPNDAGDPVDAAPNDAAPNDAAQPDSGDDAATAGPLVFNIIIRQTVQACSGCGIWFDWQGVQSQKPRLVVEYQHLGQPHTAEYQHELNGMDNAHSFFISQQNDGAKHSILVKQTPRRNGLFRADISDIPAAATIVSATLHLHIETDEGLANSDNSSVLAVHVCDRPWNWDHVTWTSYDNGLAWSQAGGDFGALIREIRAKEDLHDLGFSKANPNAHFDFTAHVQQLQAARE